MTSKSSWSIEVIDARCLVYQWSERSYPYHVHPLGRVRQPLDQRRTEQLSLPSIALLQRCSKVWYKYSTKHRSAHGSEYCHWG